jgi:hypothetical protein
MSTEQVLLLAALCFASIRTDYVRRGRFLVLAILFWGLSWFLTALNFERRAQYDPSYDYGTLLSYGSGLCLVASLLALFGACWQAQRNAREPAEADGTQLGPAPEETPPDPSDRLRELLDKDE